MIMEEVPFQYIENICRACMAKDMPLQYIFNTQIDSMPVVKLLSLISTINISPNDGLPNTICANCISKLLSAYDFQQTCLNSDLQLRSTLITLNYQKNEIEKINETPDMQISRPNTRTSTAIPSLVTITQTPIITSPASSVPNKVVIAKECINKKGKFNSIVEQQKADLNHVKAETFTISDVNSSISPQKKHETIKEEHTSDTDYDDTSLLVELPNQNSHIDDNIEKDKSTKIYECNICKKVFNKKCRLTRHMNVHNEDGKPFECDKCKQRFSTESHLRRHSIVHSDILTKLTTVINKPDNYRCPECTREFQKQESLSSHMRTHKNIMSNKEYLCGLCSKSFEKLSLLTRHLKSHDEMKHYKCNLCNKTFALNAQLIDHVNRHNGVKPHVCHVCQKGFQQSCTLKDHLRTHSGETPFLCSECGKAFNNSSNLRQHLLRHSGIKPFQCPECPSKFTCKGGLKSHMTTHTRVKPYICDICGSSFTKPYSLAKHKRIHTGERPYACEVCEMRFNSSDHVKRHMRTHTGEKPYTCKFCSRAFAQSNDLVKHTRGHVGEKTYQCHECSAAFRLHTELRAHIQQHFKQQQSVLGMNGSDTNSNSEDSLSGAIGSHNAGAVDSNAPTMLRNILNFPDLP